MCTSNLTFTLGQTCTECTKLLFVMDHSGIFKPVKFSVSTFYVFICTGNKSHVFFSSNRSPI